MLKSTELMLEDWVKYGLVYYQVMELKSNGDIRLIETEKNTHVELTIDSIENRLEPVLLTSEILEKNFPSVSHDCVTNYSLNEAFAIEEYAKLFALNRVYDAVFTSSFWIADIQYVHELQHILKFLGIEKEIKL